MMNQCSNAKLFSKTCRKKGATGSISGHSLIEVMIALPLLTAIVLAAGGLIAVASKSRALSEGLIADQIASLQTSQQFLSDLQFAASIAETSDHSIEFSVSDRTGDGMPESIRYHWSGIEGEPLSYQINEMRPVDIAENVGDFTLNRTLRKITQTTILKHHDDSSSGVFNSKPINAGEPVAQSVVTNLPASATTWSLDRVRFMARASGALDGVLTVSIVAVDNLLQPVADRVYESQKVTEHRLDSEFSWVDVKFWNTQDLSQPVAIVFSYESGKDAAGEVCFESGGLNMTDETAWMTSRDDGSTWSIPNANDDLRFYALGTHNGLMTERTVVEQVQLTLQLGVDNQISYSSARLFNEPEVALVNSPPANTGGPIFEVPDVSPSGGIVETPLPNPSGSETPQSIPNSGELEPSAGEPVDGVGIPVDEFEPTGTIPNSGESEPTNSNPISDEFVPVETTPTSGQVEPSPSTTESESTEASPTTGEFEEGGFQ